MAKNKLTIKTVDSLKHPGLYSDGGNLWIKVTPSLTKSWVFRYKFDGKERYMGLGAYGDVSLSEARILADTYRRIYKSGIDPIEQRKAENTAKQAERLNNVSFAFCAEKYIESHSHGWKNAKHAQQWTNTLEQYAYPAIGELPVKDVETAHILRILEPIWTTKTETASRVRSRLENVLDWATTRGYRSGDNPARWKAHLENLLPKPSRVKKVEHHAALPYPKMPEFMQAIRQQQSVSAMALEFLVLTAARTNEVIGARWEEINFEEKVWIIPGERMKVGREHRVPLSGRCLEILDKAEAIRQSGFIFPGGKAGKSLSNAAMDKLLQVTMGFNCTVHGFRSSFRDWAGERTHYAPDLCEMALAHTIKNKAEAAYRRGDMLEKRRQLMNDWLRFCETVSVAAEVVPLKRVKGSNPKT